MVRAKTKRKKPANKQCSVKGCRKVRRDDTEFCRQHQNGSSQQKVASNGADQTELDEGVIRLDGVDALKFGKIDAELRNAMQGQKIADYQMSEMQTLHKQRMKELQANKEHLGHLIAAHKAEYMELVTALAEKYGIDDPTMMTIDPDNGIVRDLRKQ